MFLVNALQTTIGIILGLVSVGSLLWKFFFKKWYTAYRESQERKWTTVIAELRGQQHIQEDIRLKVNRLQAGQRNMLDIIGIASWESDNKGNLDYVSAAFCELAGCQPTEVKGRSWIGKIADFDRRRVVEGYNEAIQNASEFTMVFSINLGNGMYQKVAPVIIHNKDDEGNVLSSIGRLDKVDEPYKL